MKIIVRQFVKEGMAQNYIDLFKGMIEPTRKEKGCIIYELLQDEKDPHILTINEEWESQEVLDKHFEMPYFKEIIPQLGAFIERTDSNFYKRVF